MTKIRLTKEFGFECSHALKNYDGLCRNIHGHSYRLFVTIAGFTKNVPNHPKDGMVMDFGDLKKIVFQEIIEKYDHTLVINESVSDEEKESYRRITGRVVFTPYQPTCENMVRDFADIIGSRLPQDVKLVSLKLFETPSSCAEWNAEDQAE